MRFLIGAILGGAAAIAAPPSVSGPTFNKDVLPVLQKNCQVCHRPGEVAPMSFLTYESTRPWAKAIKTALLSKKMPPWTADPKYGHFAGAPSISDADVQAIAKWADTGAPEGDAKDKPKPIEWPADGWRIKPDVVVDLGKPVEIPAKGELPITGYLVPNPFKQDTWVTSVEIRPGNRSVVHHVVVTFPPHNDDVKYGPGAPLFPRGENLGPAEAFLEAVYVPGVPPSNYGIHNSAKLIKAGSDIRIGVHYTTNGTPTTDLTQVGFVIAKEPPKNQFVTLSPSTGSAQNFKIPAGEPNFEARLEVVFDQDADLVWFMPHMHLRGKDMTYKLTYPTGESETVLSSKWDFDWQLGYDTEKPIKVPKGSKLSVVAHYDNSANNRLNPDPTQDVRWGDQTWDEMMVPWFGVVVPASADSRKIISYTPEYARPARGN